MHFQELNERMETTEPKYIQDAIAGYLRQHVKLPAQDWYCFWKCCSLSLETRLCSVIWKPTGTPRQASLSWC